MIKKFLLNCLIIFAVIVFLATNSFAAVAITKDNLTESLQNYFSSDSNTTGYSVSVSNDVINLKSDNENYNISYDLTNQPKFSYGFEVTEGMSYQDYLNEINNLILPMFGYIAVAGIEGADMSKATQYFLLTYLAAALNMDSAKYIIVDDTDPDANIDIDPGDKEIILVSEFEKNVIETVKKLYPEKQTLSDQGLNSYTLDFERLDTTDTSCRIVTTLSVNTNADFSKINSMNSDATIPLDENITKENADFVVTLKVGQKCELKSSNEITDYEFYGASNSVEMNADKTEITAVKPGELNGYITVGDQRKSIYITVEENAGNETLDPIVLNLDGTSNGDTSNNANNNNNSSTNDGKEMPTRLPDTGLKNLIIVLIAATVTMIIGIMMLRKYRDVK